MKKLTALETKMVECFTVLYMAGKVDFEEIDENLQEHVLVEEAERVIEKLEPEVKK